MEATTEKEAAAMPERENTCCFTGHREYKLPWGSDENDPRCHKLQQQLFDAVDAVYAAGIRHFICGMANGCDLYFFDAARYLRLQHPEVTIEAAIPYSGQGRPLAAGAARALCLRPAPVRLSDARAGDVHPRVHDAPQPLHGRCLAHPHRGV